MSEWNIFYIIWRGADILVLSIFYPDKNLEIREFILVKNDPNGPLSNLLNNSHPLSNSNIIIWKKYDSKKINFEGGEYQSSIEKFLWPIDPSSKDNIIKLEVIRNPENNTKIEIVKARLNINPNQLQNDHHKKIYHYWQ